MKTLNDEIIDFILKELRRYENNIPLYRKTSDMEYHSYMKAAYEDILFRLMHNLSSDPLPIVEEYRAKMDEFACMNPLNSFMFSLAHDIAEDTIDEIFMIKIRKEKCK